jgi:hypothetical protein
MAKDEIVVLESRGQVNNIALDMNIVPFHSLSNLENVHYQCYNDVSMFDEVHLQAMELQTLLYLESHNIRTFICWSFFVVNDNPHVNLMNPQMLQCVM